MPVVGTVFPQETLKMAIPIIPKSEARINNNVIVGYGEVPSVISQCGRTGWGLPNGKVVYSQQEAQAFARKLDQVIRANMRDPKQLLH